jgi:hypothetical protein
MQYLLSSLTKHGIGSRALTDTDFFQICESEGTEVYFSDRRYAFFFTIPDEGDLKVIVLPKRLKGLRFLFAAFHELAHCLLHAGHDPSIAFLKGRDRRHECEADAVALIALFPSPLPEDAQFPIEGRFAKKLWKERQRLCLRYGI